MLKTWSSMGPQTLGLWHWNYHSSSHLNHVWITNVRVHIYGRTGHILQHALLGNAESPDHVHCKENVPFNILISLSGKPRLIPVWDTKLGTWFLPNWSDKKSRCWSSHYKYVSILLSGWSGPTKKNNIWQHVFVLQNASNYVVSGFIKSTIFMSP